MTTPSEIDLGTPSTEGPVRVDSVDEVAPSRFLWLVKWLLVLPHVVVLAFLWTAFVVLTVVAFFAILFTGRYPRTIFDFNVGVLRWSWRVSYYGYGVLATDRYPPFTLAEVEGYPTHLDVEYPERLSRGLVLVKWWLLAVPHYIVVGVLLGSGVWAVQQARSDELTWMWGGGLVGILVLVAGVVLAVTGRYPPSLYDLLLGLQRWVLRVTAYATLMTDRYPPFRLDQGPHEPLSVRKQAPVPPTVVPPGVAPAHRWTAGRVVTVVAGSVVALSGLGLTLGGTAALVADQTLRDGGYLTGVREQVDSSGHAVVLGEVSLEASGGGSQVPAAILGDVRVTASPRDTTPLFVGIAAPADVDSYLAGVARRVPGRDRGVERAGGPPAQPPGDVDIWVASASGSGEQVVFWAPRAGEWTLVVMNADGSRGVSAEVELAATVPWLNELGVVLLAVGVALIVLGGLLVAAGIRSASVARGP